MDGVLLDLGLSSDQLAARERGFSFAAEGALDMRFDPTAGESAADLVNTLEADALADIFWRYGEERLSRPIARRIVEARKRAPITRADELARVVAGVVHGRPGGVHPATRVFQALRIAVNDELGSLEAALPRRWRSRGPAGASRSSASTRWRTASSSATSSKRSAAVSARPMRRPVSAGAKPTLRIITKRPLTAGEAELAANPRARSAKLRVAERLAETLPIPE